MSLFIIFNGSICYDIKLSIIFNVVPKLLTARRVRDNIIVSNLTTVKRGTKV